MGEVRVDAEKKCRFKTSNDVEGDEVCEVGMHSNAALREALQVVVCSGYIVSLNIHPNTLH